MSEPNDGPSVTIREATSDDVVGIVSMGTRFAESVYGPELLKIDPTRLASLVENCIQSDAGLVLVAQRQNSGDLLGVLGLILHEQPMSGEPIAAEIVWWMDPEARGGFTAIRMLKTGEAWARAQGAKKIQMIAPTERIETFYERCGFTRLEVNYQRSL